MKRTLLAVTSALLLAFVATGAAQAATPSRTLATPSTACSIMVTYGVGGYSSFGNCMGNLNRDVEAYRFPDDPQDPNSATLSLSQRCTQFEEGIFDPAAGGLVQISYPFFFAEFPGWPFPELTAQNHRQCEITLFTYHTLASLLGPPA